LRVAISGENYRIENKVLRSGREKEYAKTNGREDMKKYGHR